MPFILLPYIDVDLVLTFCCFFSNEMLFYKAVCHKLLDYTLITENKFENETKPRIFIAVVFSFNLFKLLWTGRN